MAARDKRKRKWPVFRKDSNRLRSGHLHPASTHLAKSLVPVLDVTVDFSAGPRTLPTRFMLHNYSSNGIVNAGVEVNVEFENLSSPSSPTVIQKDVTQAIYIGDVPSRMSQPFSPPPVINLQPAVTTTTELTISVGFEYLGKHHVQHFGFQAILHKGELRWQKKVPKVRPHLRATK